MKYKVHKVLNSSIFLDRDMEELMRFIQEGWDILNIHNNRDGQETLYLLKKEV